MFKENFLKIKTKLDFLMNLGQFNPNFKVFLSIFIFFRTPKTLSHVP